MRNIRRLLTLMAATAIMVATFAVPAVASADGTLLARINNSRAGAGMAPVEMYWDLTDDARAHTGRMIEAGHIYHNSNLSGVTGSWQKLGENVGVGVDANSLHDAFMASSAHRNNILGDFNYVGIGTKTSEDGLLWVTVVFMKAAPGLNGGGETTTTTVAPTTTTTAPPAHSPQPGPAPTEPVPSETPTTTVPPTPQPEAPAVRTASSSASGGAADDAPTYTTFGRPHGRPAIAL